MPRCPADVLLEHLPCESVAEACQHARRTAAKLTPTTPCRLSTAKSRQNEPSSRPRPTVEHAQTAGTISTACHHSAPAAQAVSPHGRAQNASLSSWAGTDVYRRTHEA